MIDSPNSPGQADKPSNGGSVRSASRRRLLQAGISAAPVAMTVASRPVLATTNPPGTCPAPSGFISTATISGPPGGPCAGLSPSERQRIFNMIRALPREITLVMIEHDMDVALGLADRVTVMNRGRVMAEGTPAEVQSNPEVRDVYFGHV